MPEGRPTVIAWETTRRCTLKCRHCRGSARNSDYEGELSTKECLAVIDSLAAFVLSADAPRPRPPILILTGGEPMMRDDIYALARHASDAGLFVVMAPCGKLITDATARRLKEAGVRAISISLDGATADTHDAFRGVPGAFNDACRGLAVARQANIPFQINTTVTRNNVDSMATIHQLAVALGAFKHDLFFLVPTGRGEALRDQALTPEQADAALRKAREISEQSTIGMKITCAPQSVRLWDESPTTRGGHASPATGCMAGDGFVFISHTGILQPCGFLAIPSGNLRAHALDFGRTYSSSSVFDALQTKSAYTGKCRACEYLNTCGGCRARAFAATGNYLDAEPGCAYIPGSRQKAES